MKNIGLFNSEVEYNDFINGADETFFPNVSYLKDDDKVMYQKEGMSIEFTFTLTGYSDWQGEITVEYTGATNMTWKEWVELGQDVPFQGNGIWGVDVNGYVSAPYSEEGIGGGGYEGARSAHITKNGVRVKGDEKMDKDGEYDYEVVAE